MVAFREEAVMVDTVMEIPNMEEKRVELTFREDTLIVEPVMVEP